VVSGNGRIISHRHDFFGIDPLALEVFVFIKVPGSHDVKFYRIEKFRSLDFPGISVSEPVVRHFNLIAVFDSLVKNPVS